MKKKLPLLLALCLLLTGCAGWMDGHYSSESNHEIEGSSISTDNLQPETYAELVAALADMAQTGTESAIFYVNLYTGADVSSDMERAVREVLRTDPYAAYAVSGFTWEAGSSGGVAALTVTAELTHDAADLLRIRKTADTTSALSLLGDTLDACGTSVVLYIVDYTEVDFVQYVRDYAAENPHMVMEVPETVANIYPDSGSDRIVELKFTYQNSSEALQSMQSLVGPVFTAARLYVSGASSDNEKLMQLYAFLMERSDYTIETSITPTYSLLHHGVGDARAFAQVYSKMCRDAGLTCMVITGTRAGEPWYWNLVEDDGHYYHIDLLTSYAGGGFAELTDEQMEGYVWDYSAYPAAEPLPEPEETEPEETQGPGESSEATETPTEPPTEEATQAPTENPAESTAPEETAPSEDATEPSGDAQDSAG